MTSLRFCMLTTFYPPHNFGGDGLGVQRLSRALVRRGHHVTVVYDADAFGMLHRGDATRPAQPSDDGVEVVALHSRLGALSPLLTHQTGRPVVHGRRLAALLTREPYDVINYHNVSLVGGPGLLSLGDAVKIYVAHEHWLVCPTHILWRHGREPCPGRQCLRCTLHYGRPPQLWRYTGLLRRRIRHVDTFVAFSEFSRRKHAEFGFPRDMEVLPSFAPDTPGVSTTARPHPRPYFLFAGRLERIKGLDDVIPVFESYEDADLLIVGDGTHEAELRHLAGANPRVRFVGRMPEGRLAAHYAHALAVIVPSICYETFGIVVIEAFRAGVPVLARRIGPFPELVSRSGAGLLFQGADELRDGMHSLQQQPDVRRRLGRAARQAFKAHWSEDAVLRGYLDIVRRAAERRGRRRVAEALAMEATAS